GFAAASPSEEQQFTGMKKDVMAELKHLFRPEFLNRVDEIIVFHKLTPGEIKTIARKMVDQLTDKASGMGLGLSFTDPAVERISREGYDLIYGARPLRRALQQKIEDRLADRILSGEVKSGEKILCDCGA